MYENNAIISSAIGAGAQGNIGILAQVLNSNQNMSPGRLFVDFPPGNWQDVNVQLNNQFNLVANSEIQGQNVVNNSRSTPNASKKIMNTPQLQGKLLNSYRFQSLN